MSEDGDVSPGSCSSTPTTTPAPTTTPGPSPQPTLTRACFDLILRSVMNGWRGAVYSILTVGGGVVATGTLDGGYDKIDEVCVPETPACYAIQVTAGFFPLGISWSLGYGTLSGGAPSESDFYVTDAGDLVLSGCTSSPTVSPAPTMTPAPSQPPNSWGACFDLVLRDSYGSGWLGAVYSILTVEGGVVATGTLDGGYDKIDEVCVPEAPACYVIQVTAGKYPSGYSWSLGDGTLSGGATFESDFFVSGDVLFSGCTSSPTASPAPTATPAPSQPPTLTRACFDVTLEGNLGSFNGAMYSISTVADGVVVARGWLTNGVRTVDEVCVPGAPACYTIRTAQVRDFPRISWSLGNGALSGGFPSGSDFYVSGDGEIAPGCTSSPAASPAPTHFPTTTSVPSLTLAPSAAVLTTFAEVQSSLAEGATTSVNRVEGVILFERRLDLISKHQSLIGRNNAALDGGLATSFFWLQKSTLTLEDITLRRGRSVASSGGCARAQTSTLVLVRVLVLNCTSDAAAGGFFLEANSWLFASQSIFDSNAALGSSGGVAYLPVLKSTLI